MKNERNVRSVGFFEQSIAAMDPAAPLLRQTAKKKPEPKPVPTEPAAVLLQQTPKKKPEPKPAEPVATEPAAPPWRPESKKKSAPAVEVETASSSTGPQATAPMEPMSEEHWATAIAAAFALGGMTALEAPSKPTGQPGCLRAQGRVH